MNDGNPAPPAGGALRWSALLLAALLVLCLNTVPLASNDLWLQIKVGELTMRDGAIPRTLLFPFTELRDNVFNAHEWLPSILFYELSRPFGVPPLMFVQGALALLQFGLCVALARRLSGSLGVALLMATLAMAVANYRYVLRPEIFALLLLTGLLAVLARYRDERRGRVLLWTAPVAVAWANCHGSFVLGPVVCGVFAFGEGVQAARAASGGALVGRLRRGLRAGGPFALAGLGMLAASVVNPRGVQLLRFAFDVQASEAMRTRIKEWLPTFHPLFMAEPAFWLFVAMGAMALFALVRWRRSVDVADALLLAMFATLALERNRHIVWFGFVALVVCARLVGRSGAAVGRERELRLASLALALAGIAVGLTRGNARGAFIYDSPSNNFTPAMVAELADPKLTGDVLNSYELGSELIYRDWPRLRPSIDSRIDSYGDLYFLAHADLFRNEAMLRRFIAAYGVNHMLLLRRDFAGVSAMPRIAAEWHIRFADAKMLLLERNEPLPASP